MPLKVMDVVELRLKVIADVRSGLSPREVAARHGVGKSQLYVWLARYAEAGAEGLLPRSRRPLVSPGQLSGAVEDEIVRWRKQKPRWGAKKIRSMLARDGWVPLPAVSTVHQVLRRRGLVEHVPRRREPAGGWQRFVRPHCNDLWHVDATRHVLANGRLDYNTARPHEAIGQHYPAEIYLPDQAIELPAIELAPADPYPDDCLKRQVGTGGRLHYANTRLKIDSRWDGITVGLIRDHGRLEIYYGAALIDTLSIGTLPEPTPRGRRRTH